MKRYIPTYSEELLSELKLPPTPPSSFREIKGAAKYLCGAYKSGLFQEAEFEQLVQCLLSFYLEHAGMEKFSSFTKSLNEKAFAFIYPEARGK